MKEVIDIVQLREELSVLKQQTVIQAIRSIGRWLIIDFEGRGGGTSYKIDTWHLYIYSAWMMQTSEEGIVSFTDEPSVIDCELKRLKHKTLMNINILKVSYDTTFRFEKDIHIRVFPVRQDRSIDKSNYGYPSWMFSHEGYFTISVNPGQPIQKDFEV